MERMEFTRGAWFSKSAGGEESLFGFVALESDVYSSGTIGEATVAATQALGYQQMKPQQLEVMQSFVKGNDVFGVIPTGFGNDLRYGCLPL